IALFSVPIALMILFTIGMTGTEQWFSEFGKTETGRLILGRTGIALPYIASAATGIIFLRQHRCPWLRPQRRAVGGLPTL
ncbi:hypothetical protein ACC758_39445, partial [Rhizobium ruizarguesonis]